jgi:hypothetical protein
MGLHQEIAVHLRDFLDTAGNNIRESSTYFSKKISSTRTCLGTPHCDEVDTTVFSVNN